MRFPTLLGAFQLPTPLKLALQAFLFACILLALPAALAAQAQSTAPTSQQVKIMEQLVEVGKLDREHASPGALGTQWALLGAEYANAGDVANAEHAYNRALKLLNEGPATAAAYADVLDQLGALYRIYGRIPEALNCYREALAVRQKRSDPLQVARSQARLAELSLIAHKYKDAFKSADEAYASMLQLKNAAQADLLSALIVRAYARCGMHRCGAAQADAQQAVSTSRAAFGPDSVPAADALVALGSAQLKNGAPSDAETALHDALQIFRVHLAPSDPRLIFAMERYRDSLLALHQAEQAHAVVEQLSALNQQPRPSCPSCTVSVYGLRSPSF